MFTNQFLLTQSKEFKHKWPKMDWLHVAIGNGNYSFFCHPFLNLAYILMVMYTKLQEVFFDNLSMPVLRTCPLYWGLEI